MVFVVETVHHVSKACVEDQRRAVAAVEVLGAEIGLNKPSADFAWGEPGDGGQEGLTWMGPCYAHARIYGSLVHHIVGARLTEVPVPAFEGQRATCTQILLEHA